jgi:hypothetical protein
VRKASDPICFHIKDYKTCSQERADSVPGKTNDHQNTLLLYLSLRLSLLSSWLHAKTSSSGPLMGSPSGGGSILRPNGEPLSSQPLG